MASYTKLLVHLVWSTKLREPMIDDALKVRLHSYLSVRCQEFGCLALAVGGVADHVHLLVRLHPDVAVARLARELKAPSTRFVHRVFKREGFAWQERVGCGGVGAERGAMGGGEGVGPRWRSGWGLSLALLHPRLR
jgi:REP element-mobilizing transposase RayT